MAELTEEQIAAAEDAGASDREINAIAELKERANVFSEAWEHLQSIESAVKETELEDEYNALMRRGRAIKETVQRAVSAIDDAIGWARGSLGLDNLGNLGVYWFIPLAVISAATAALGWWIADYRKFAKRFDEQQRIADRLKGEGVDPIEAERQAAAAVAGAAPGWLQPLAQPLGLVALGTLGYLGYRIWRDQ